MKKTVRLNISLPEGLLRDIDEHANAMHLTRSGFLAQAALKCECLDDAGAFPFDMADNLREVIGTFGDIPIRRYAEIGGAPYEFDHIYCFSGKMVVPADARCLAPGLVYSPACPGAVPSE